MDPLPPPGATPAAPTPGADLPAGVLPPGATAAPPEVAPPRLRVAGLVVPLLAILPLSLLGAWSLLAGALLTQAALVLVTLGWARRTGFEPRRLLRLALPSPRALLLGAGVGLAGILAGGGLQGLARAALPRRLAELFDVGQALLGAGWSRLVLVTVVSLLPPLCEELAFRGGLQSVLLSRRSPARAIAWSAFAFAAFHLDPIRFAGVLLLGLLYGWLAWRTGSAWPSMVAHAINNGTAVLGLLWVGPEATDPAEAVSAGDAAALVIAGLAAFALLVAAARRWLPPAPEAASFLVPRATVPGGAPPPPATTGGGAPSPSGTGPP